MHEIPESGHHPAFCLLSSGARSGRSLGRDGRVVGMEGLAGWRSSQALLSIPPEPQALPIHPGMHEGQLWALAEIGLGQHSQPESGLTPQLK